MNADEEQQQGRRGNAKHSLVRKGRADYADPASVAYAAKGNRTQTAIRSARRQTSRQ
jgi:hypothetical protein